MTNSTTQVSGIIYFVEMGSSTIRRVGIGVRSLSVLLRSACKSTKCLLPELADKHSLRSSCIPAPFFDSPHLLQVGNRSRLTNHFVSQAHKMLSGLDPASSAQGGLRLSIPTIAPQSSDKTYKNNPHEAGHFYMLWTSFVLVGTR